MTAPISGGAALAGLLAAPSTLELRAGEARAGEATARAGDPERNRQIRDAAQRFEGLFIQQLFSIMRESAGGMFSGTGSEMYGQLIDQNMGDTLAGAGGMGLATTLARAMGAEEPLLSPGDDGRPLGAPARLPIAPPGTRSLGARPYAPGDAALDLGPIVTNRPVTGAAMPGATGALQSAADGMLPDSGVAPQWGRDGILTERDLASDFMTGGPGAEAAFAVRDARGFEGYYKCNLFALELARRAGFEVPLVARERGWGFPSAGAMTADANDGAMREGWAEVATDASAASIDSSIVRGEGAFLLTASGTEGRHGHVGVIERVHEIERDADGAITRVVFDGWEGRPSGARHLERRSWTTPGHAVSTNARNGLGHIEILSLRRPEEGARPEHPLHRSAGSSVLDAPIASTEGRSATVASATATPVAGPSSTVGLSARASAGPALAIPVRASR